MTNALRLYMYIYILYIIIYIYNIFYIFYTNFIPIWLLDFGFGMGMKKLTHQFKINDFRISTKNSKKVKR